MTPPPAGRDAAPAAGMDVPRVRLWLAGILAVAAALRLGGVFHDLPFSFYGDELFLMKRAMAMGTGDLNPHWFHKPSLLMYVLLAAYGAYFVVGLVVGRFESAEHFAASFLADAGPFLLLGRLVVLAFGVATVWAVYAMARRGFRSQRAGLMAAAVAAVVPGMVASSQVIKSDVPCAFFTTSAVVAFLRWREAPGWRRLALTGVVTGLAMGTHYYALTLLPAFGVMLAVEALRGRLRWAHAVAGGALLVGTFVAGFFVASPYNFLDPIFARSIVAKTETLMPREGNVQFEPDVDQEFTPGPRAWVGATGQLLSVLVGRQAMGLPLVLLAGFGLASGLLRPGHRWFAALIAAICGTFCLLAVVLATYHVQERHLSAIYPFLAAFVWPGAVAAAGWLRPPHRLRLATAATAVALIASAVLVVRRNAEIMRLDSRVVAHRWIVENLPRDGRILLDHYGPELQPNPSAVARQEALLAEIPFGPFTAPQGTRLALLRRFPPSHALPVDELGHPWWLPREATDAELRASETHRDMGNPLISRVPQTLAEYRRLGYRYVVTNSQARSRYFQPSRRAEAFPSFVRFYDELAALRPVRTFDPATWGGDGPVIWIYDLAQLPARPAPPPRVTPMPSAQAARTGGG